MPAHERERATSAVLTSDSDADPERDRERDRPANGGPAQERELRPSDRVQATGPQHLTDMFRGVRLTPAQRRIAQHIVQSGPRAAITSSVELAEQVGVSQPSVTRLATTLGYAGFTELQAAMREVLLSDTATSATFVGSGSGANSDRTSAAAAGSGQATLGTTPDPGHKLQQAIEHTIDGLRELQRSLKTGTTTLQNAARALADSPVLPVYGARSAQPLAAQFAFFAAKIHPDVRLLKGSASQVQDQLETATRLHASAILCLALPRYPRELQAVLESARARRLSTVLLTNSPFTALAEQADHLLIAPVASDLVFDSAVAPLQLLTVLLESIADATPERTRRRLDEFEQQATAGDYFLED